MNLKEEIKNHFSQIRNRDKNDYKRKNYFKKMNERITQYIERLIINDYINKINLQKHNSKERLNRKE